MAGATRITGFGGIVPKLAPRALQGQAAQVADNCSVTTGELRPLRKSTLAWEPDVLDELRSFFRVRDGIWFGWAAEGVDMRTAPLEGVPRHVFTGDRLPQITNDTIGLPATSLGRPAASRTLGIPTPPAAPSLGHAGGVGAPESRVYCYTFYSDWDEEGAPSPPSALVSGKDDGTWTVSGMLAAPPNSGNVTAAVHSGGIVTVTLDTVHLLREGEPVTFASIGGMTDLNGSFTVHAVPADDEVEIELTTAQTYTSGGTWARDVPWGTCTKRIYRTTGSTGDFQLVAEGITATSYADTLTDAQIPGDSLVSTGWEPPPVDMVGLQSLSSGVLAGFREGGRTVCFSEPYQPHAWPEAYRVRVPDEIISVAAYDTQLAVLTRGAPVVLSGTEPGQITPVRHPKPLPGLSRAGACSITDGVVYATALGLARVDLAGAALFAPALFSPEDWLALSPSTMRLAFDGQNVLIATTVNRRVLILDVSGAGGALTTATQDVAAISADEGTGAVYFADGQKVQRFNDPGAAPRVADWCSREYVLDRPMNLGAAKVETDRAYTRAATELMQAERDAIVADNATILATPGASRGAWGSSTYNRRAWNASALAPLPPAEPSVALSLYADEELVFSAEVPNDEAFTLPAGYKSDAIFVRVQATTQVRAIVLGATKKALASA